MNNHINICNLPFDFGFLRSADDDFLNMRPLLLYGLLNCMGSRGRASAIVRTPVGYIRICYMYTYMHTYIDMYMCIYVYKYIHAYVNSTYV
jgi:hypothetical protein